MNAAACGCDENSMLQKLQWQRFSVNFSDLNIGDNLLSKTPDWNTCVVKHLCCTDLSKDCLQLDISTHHTCNCIDWSILLVRIKLMLLSLAVMGFEPADACLKMQL